MSLLGGLLDAFDPANTRRRMAAAPAAMSSRDRLSGFLDEAIDKYGRKGSNLEAEENARGAQAERLTREAVERFKRPTITNEEIRRRFSTASDQSGQTFLDQAAGLRDYMGASGITGGGLIAGTLQNIEGQRIAANIGARSDLAGFAATSAALDRQRALDADLKVADVVSRPVSMIGMDTLGETIGARLGQLGEQSSYEGAMAQASAAKKAGKDSMKGDLIKGGLGLIGSLI